jgi:hypothetical protein
MNFQPADPFSLYTFIFIVIAVVAAIIYGTFLAGHRLGGPAARHAAWTAGGLIMWLALNAFIVKSGFVAAQPMPRLPLYFAFINLTAIAFALSAAGRRLAYGLPLGALVGFQAFRLPLELVLHHWANTGTIPQTMTWSGANVDIVSGITALLIAPFAGKYLRAAWLANVIGLSLLLNVARVAMLSSPLPFAWPVEPPLQLAFHLPYALIVPVCVAGALAGHVILTRALMKRAT